MMRPGLLFLIVMLLAGPAFALESAAVRSSRATVTLVTDSDSVRAGERIRVGLRLRMAPGWHTYWRNPGDAGVAPELTLKLPVGAVAGEIAWPTPLRLPEGPVMTYGYVGEVMLPVSVTPGLGALEIEAVASWLVCERICVPEEGTFHLSVPAGGGGMSDEAGLFAAAAARQPGPSAFEARVGPDGILSLAGAGLSAATVKDAWFFPAAWGSVEAGAAQTVSVDDGTVRLGLKPGPHFDASASLDGTVVLSGPGGKETYVQVSAAPGAATPVSASLIHTLLLAFLAGLILNLMPCVFPVLAMKALGLARLSGQERRAVRAHAASYTAGVLIAFMGLGVALLALRSAGGAAGWGFQFQSPMFVAAMAGVLFVVGLNLSGVFQVGPRFAGAGQGLAAQGGHAGSFFTGLLAVLVATPCTAPFMGAAIAAALAAPATVTLLVFAAMGVGLAAPYAWLAFVSATIRLLPRPGPWMTVMKGALAFPMYAAVAWLVWVVSVEAGPGGVLATVGGLVVLGFAAWIHGLSQESGWRLGPAVTLAAVLAAAGILSGVASAPTSSAGLGGFETFTPARLAALRTEGRPVFVNMTAAWCVTCLVNERLALSPEAVQQAFADHHVAYLKGDWTRGDPAITAFLREHAHDGVPLYVYYPRGDGAPSVLPSILTERRVLSVLEQTTADQGVALVR